MTEFFTVITDAGRNLVAQATQAGEKVNITHMAVGDGGGVPVTPNEEQTQLVNECWRGLVATYKQEGTNIIIDTYIPPDEGNFTIREMGVFTADGVLFAVCNTPAMPKVLPIKGAVDSFVFGMKLDVTNIDMKYIEIHTNPMLDFIKNSEKGQPNGVPILDEHGKIPADNMPANTPTLGEDGKIPQEQLPDLNFDTAGSAAAVQNNLNAHINNKQNPHGVTAAQVGAYDKNQSLTSVTAGLFGLSASAVPNDVLAKIKTLIDTTTSLIPKVETGTYIGTGLVGPYYPNRITFGFSPKIIFIVPHTPDDSRKYQYTSGLIYIKGSGTYLKLLSDYTGAMSNTNRATLSENVFSWWATNGNDLGDNQCNYESCIYGYLAIG